MSQQNGFGSGFLLGTLIGGVVGGILGAVITSRLDSTANLEEDNGLNTGENNGKTTDRSRKMRASANENLEIEATRRSLEDKIAQLNATIDDVRRQLGNVNSINISNE